MSRQLTKTDLDAAIRAAGKRRDINEVNRIFRSLGTRSDVYTYTPVITAAGNNNRMDLAEESFRIALANNQANVVTLNSMITAAGNNNRTDLAEEAFRIALARNQADIVTHGNINDARQKNTISAQPTPTTRYRHNPYSFVCSWEADNTVPPTSTELSRVTLRQ
ncbi:MAG: hypothetical protein NTZ67_09585 [Gammaproteobacteria bacterium]|nr:hypothetical protein [Gammaproteobacteria bacterium]